MAKNEKELAKIVLHSLDLPCRMDTKASFRKLNRQLAPSDFDLQWSRQQRQLVLQQSNSFRQLQLLQILHIQ
jgi:hypothetical protein